jgi:hypothetical protein
VGGDRQCGRASVLLVLLLLGTSLAAFLGFLGPLDVSAQAPPTPIGETETEVTSPNVTVLEKAAPLNLSVTYHYFPSAAALSEGPTLVNFTLKPGRGLVLFADNPSNLSVEVPVSPTAQAPPGGKATSSAEFSLLVYCALPNMLTFPVGNASIGVGADSQANGILQPSRGVAEIHVRCEGPQRRTEPDSDKPADAPGTQDQENSDAALSPSPPSTPSRSTPAFSPIASLVAAAVLTFKRRVRAISPPRETSRLPTGAEGPSPDSRDS